MHLITIKELERDDCGGLRGKINLKMHVLIPFILTTAIKLLLQN